jgi:hypothetical protein
VYCGHFSRFFPFASGKNCISEFDDSSITFKKKEMAS